MTSSFQSPETRKLHLGGNSLLLIRGNQRAAGLAKIEFTLALRAATASFGACIYLLAPCAAHVIIRAAFVNAVFAKECGCVLRNVGRGCWITGKQARKDESFKAIVSIRIYCTAPFPIFPAGRVRASFQICPASYLREDVDGHISFAVKVAKTSHVERVSLERRSLRHIVNQGTRSSTPATIVRFTNLGTILRDEGPGSRSTSFELKELSACTIVGRLLSYLGVSAVKEAEVLVASIEIIAPAVSNDSHAASCLDRKVDSVCLCRIGRSGFIIGRSVDARSGRPRRSLIDKTKISRGVNEKYVHLQNIYTMYTHSRTHCIPSFAQLPYHDGQEQIGVRRLLSSSSLGIQVLGRRQQIRDRFPNGLLEKSAEFMAGRSEETWRVLGTGEMEV